MRYSQVEYDNIVGVKLFIGISMYGKYFHTIQTLINNLNLNVINFTRFLGWTMGFSDKLKSKPIHCQNTQTP